MAIARQGVPFKLIYEFYDGINDSSQEANLAGDQQVMATEMAECSNYALHLPGSNALTERPGLEKVSTNTFDEAPQLVFAGLHDNYVCTLTKIWDDEASSLDTGLTSSTTWDAASFNGKDIFVNGTEERETNDGTTFTAVGGTPPNFKYIESYNNYLFGAGHDNGKLRWSALQNEDSWPAINELDLTSDENDPITGMARFRDSLMVFTQSRFFHITGTGLDDIGIAHTAHEGPGCTANESIVVTDHGIFWWSPKGIAFSRDGFTVDLPMMRCCRFLLSIQDQTKNDDVFACWEPMHERVLFWHTSITAVPRVFVYYYERDAMFTWTADIAEVTAAGTLPGSTDWFNFPSVHVAGTVNSVNALFQVKGTVTTDHGAAISSSLATAALQVGDGTAEARCRDITVEYMNPTNATISLYAYLDDDSYNGSATDSWTMAASSTTRERRVRYTKKFRKMQLALQESASTAFTPRRIIVRDYYLND